MNSNEQRPPVRIVCTRRLLYESSYREYRCKWAIYDSACSERKLTVSACNKRYTVKIIYSLLYKLVRQFVQ